MGVVVAVGIDSYKEQHYDYNPSYEPLNPFLASFLLQIIPQFVFTIINFTHSLLLHYNLRASTLLANIRACRAYLFAS
jgi:hypothetical protein